MDLPSRVAAWRDRGADEEFQGRRIHVTERDGGGPLLVFLHGFPSSSYDWRLLLELESEHAALAPDFLGFGLSDKPRDHEYTLHWQADMVEELVRRRGGSEPVSLVAHDMGTSVATERVLDAVIELRPAAPVTRFEDLGHYPQIEDPQRVADALHVAFSA